MSVIIFVASVENHCGKISYIEEKCTMLSGAMFFGELGANRTSVS